MIEAIRQWLAAHPECASMSDAEVAGAINAPTETALAEAWANERTIYNVLGSAAGEAFLAALEAAGAGDATIRRALAWLKPDQAGVDLASPVTRAMLAALAGAGVVDAGSVAVLLALAERRVGWFEAAYGRPVQHLEVAAARRG
jgi:hypothetical protein